MIRDRTEYRKQYRIKNKEKELESRKNYHIRNKEKELEYNRVYRTKNKESILERKRIRYILFKKKVKEYLDITEEYFKYYGKYDEYLEQKNKIKE